MKLLIVVPNLSDGGAEFVAREWARWLSASGHTVDVAVTAPRDRDPALPGVSIHSLGGRGLFGHVVALRRLIRRSNPDAVVALLPYYNIAAMLAGLSLGSRKPLLLISGRNMEVPFPEVHGRKVRTTRFLSRRLYRRSDIFIAISHAVAAEAQALYGFEPERVVVVPNPATAKLKSIVPGVDRRSTSHVRLIVPGRLVAQKNSKLALAVANELKKRGWIASVDYFGTGPDEQSIADEAVKVGVPVAFRGWVDAWHEEVDREIAVVLLPSRVEGFGNVLIEAAGSGIPSVVWSGALGVSDAVIPGVTGQLSPLYTAVALADAVEIATKLCIPSEISAWIERFSPNSSGAALVGAVTHAKQLAEGVDTRG